MRAGFWAVAATVLILDQWTKRLAVEMLSAHQTVTLIPGVLALTQVHNTGTAFGLLPGRGSFLTGVAALAVVLISGYWILLTRGSNPPNPWLACGLALDLGGALGNLIDRVRVGHVIDFLELPHWPVFNVADSAITIGACMVAGYFLFQHERRQPRGLRVASAGSPHPDP